MITFAPILIGTGLFFLGFAVHMVWWRLRRPQDDILGLGLCLLALPAAALVVGLAPASPSATRVVQAVLAYGFTSMLAGCYIIAYPAAQAVSPSMLIALRLGEQGAAGMTEAELLASLDEEAVCGETIRSLLHEQFAHVEEGRFVLGARGRAMMTLCRRWRQFLGLAEGEG